MSRLATAFVLGYHGCSVETAHAAISRRSALLWSEKSYDWLGAGIYFWEADSQRAWEWAQDRCRRTGERPCVIGAAIDLGNCLDLLTRKDQDLLRDAYATLVETYATGNRPLPKNEPARFGDDRDRKLRRLDCAVIDQLHVSVSNSGLEPFDTVRGMFTEGAEIYPGSGFYERSHVQIAVRNPAAIKGLFLPPELDLQLA